MTTAEDAAATRRAWRVRRRRKDRPLLAQLHTRAADGQVYVVEVPASLLTHSPREDAAQRRVRHRKLAEALRKELADRGASLPRSQAERLEGAAD